MTSMCCKVMESIVSESVAQFLRVNGLISKDQYGFLAKIPTYTHLLVTLNEISLLADAKMQVDAAYTLFGVSDLSSFPLSIQTSNQPNIEILGAPIGDAELWNKTSSLVNIRQP